MSSHNEPTIYINFENIPIDKMGAEIIPSKLNEIFDKLVNDDCYFDLERLRVFIERYKLNLLTKLDNYPHEIMASIIISDFLYGINQTDVSSNISRYKKKHIHNFN